MNEQQTQSVIVLNELYDAEMHTLLPRLSDLGLAVSRLHPVEGALVRRIAQEAREHREWLIEEIQRHRGSVWPTTLDIHSASLHYNAATAVLPQVQRNIESLITRYQQAGGQTGLSSSALDVIRRILRRYEGALDAMRQFAAVNRKPEPAAPTV